MSAVLPARWGYAAMALVVIAWAGASRGCLAKECTAIGCANGVGATLRTANGSWADGEYELSLRADAIEATCKFRLPDQLPDLRGSTTRLDCGPDLEFGIRPNSECQSGCDGNSCWQRCEPIPGKFTMDASLRSMPERIELSIARNGESILAGDVRPEYHDVYANGPDCGITCRRAMLDFTVP